MEHRKGYEAQSPLQDLELVLWSGAYLVVNIINPQLSLLPAEVQRAVATVKHGVLERRLARQGPQVPLEGGVVLLGGDGGEQLDAHTASHTAGPGPATE